MIDGNLRGQIPQPRATNNAPLAMTLHICGVPFTRHEGVMYPGFNIYSHAFLAEKGYKGKSPDVAIKELWEKGVPGNIVYQFEHTPDYDEIALGWDEMAEAIQKADSANPDATTSTAAIDVRSVKDIAKICCQFTKARKLFFGDKNTIPLWRRRDANGNLYIPACKASEGASHTERDGERVMVVGSMKIKSVKV